MARGPILRAAIGPLAPTGLSGTVRGTTSSTTSPVRVMRTCDMMGEVVGMAKALCKQRETSPHGVYEQHLDELKRLMQFPILERFLNQIV